MGRLAKCVAILAALSVLCVLITPWPDELPCTAGHKSTAVWALIASPTPVILPPLHSNHDPLPIVARFFVVPDIVSLTCAFLC
jgi:hypothetical protein